MDTLSVKLLTPLALLTLVTLTSALGLAPTTAATLTLTADTPWVFSTWQYNSSNAPLLAAVRDLRTDWYNVLGARPALLLAVPPAPVPGSVSSPNITSVLFGQPQDLFLQPLVAKYAPPNCTAGGRETHCVFLAACPFFGGASLVVLGVDDVGLLFAVYTLAEAVLGVGPLDYWLQIPPQRAAPALQFPASRLPVIHPSPTFAERAFFVNDEDLFAGLRPAPAQASVWSLETFDQLFSTILRLKGNGVLPGTNIFPDDPVYALARRRGLWVSSHHYNLLFMSPVVQGVDHYFPEDYNFQTRPDAMMYAWRQAAEAQMRLGGQQALYTVGYRGAGDESAPCLGPCTVRDRAAHVSWAVGNQTAFVRARQPDARFLAWLWQEGLEYLETGAFVIPPNTTLVFTDGGDGQVRGLQYATSGAGIYTHVAMLDGRANQLTEMVPIGRIFGSVSSFVKSNATSIFILNVSDLLPYLMGTLANFRAVYDSSPFVCNMTQGDSCQRLQHAWVAGDFAQGTLGLPAAAGEVVASAYDAYFSVPYLSQGNADSLLARLIDEAADKAAGAGRGTDAEGRRRSLGDYDWVASQKVMCQAYGNVSGLLDGVPQSRRQAFASTVLLSIGTHCQMTTALVKTQAAGGASGGQAAVELLQQALAAMDQLVAIQQAAEGERFRGLFGFDGLTCAPRARRAILAAIDRLVGGKAGAALSYAYGADIFSCEGYKGMYEYLEAYGHETFPLERPPSNASRMVLWPQVYCAYDDGRLDNASWCLPHPSGGAFKANATVYMKTSAGLPVRYTTDGSAPNATSPVFSQPLRITETTTFTVALADPSIDPFAPPTVATFDRVA